jgi:hypothetical protein
MKKGMTIAPQQANTPISGDDMIFGTNGTLAPVGQALQSGIFGANAGAGGDISFYTTIAKACTFKNLYLQVDVGPGGGSDVVFSMLKNLSNTGINVDITGGATTGSNLIGTFSCIPGDIVAIQLTQNAGTLSTIFSCGGEITFP